MSDQDESIFTEEGNTEVTPVVSDPKPTETPSLTIPESLIELVGEGKKYSTVEAALSSVAPSQSHIIKLETEMAEMREELIKRKTAEELVERLNKTPSENQEKPNLDAAQLVELVEKTLEKKETAKTAKENVKSVMDKMIDAYGETSKADEAYRTKATQLGMSLNYLNSLCATSPKAAMELLGLESKQEGSHSKIHSDFNNEANLTKPDEEPKPVSVMGGASSKDMVNAWRAAGKGITG